MSNVIFSLTQAVQLAALLPCLFTIAYLCVFYGSFKHLAIPLLYFTALAGSFLSPLLSAFIDLEAHWWIRLFIELCINLIPELALLFVLQTIWGKPPGWLYWLVLGVPLIGGWGFLYLHFTGGATCFANGTCISSEYTVILYRILSGGLLLLLLVAFFSRMAPETYHGNGLYSDKYLIVMALIFFSVLLLVTDLVYISHIMRLDQIQLLRAVVGLLYVYLAMFAALHVFYKSFVRRPLRSSNQEQNFAREQQIAEMVEKILHGEKVYKEIGFNREALAKKVGVNETTLSRAINHTFRKSFSELINDYRIEEAKRALRDTDLPITTVAYDAGFNSLASFNRVFKSATGFPPSEYRAQSKKA